MGQNPEQLQHWTQWKKKAWEISDIPAPFTVAWVWKSQASSTSRNVSSPVLVPGGTHLYPITPITPPDPAMLSFTPGG